MLKVCYLDITLASATTTTTCFVFYFTVHITLYLSFVFYCIICNII